jgi:hypothetical protein
VEGGAGVLVMSCDTYRDNKDHHSYKHCTRKANSTTAQNYKRKLLKEIEMQRNNKPIYLKNKAKLLLLVCQVNENKIH